MPGKNPLISVVIPSWNSENQLRENLPFVYRASSRVNAEIVIIDDASSYDKSVQLLKREKKRGKIRFFQNRVNQGFSYTVNRGVSLAKGSLIMLLNTDVRPSSDCFLEAIRLFDDKDIFAVTFNSKEAWAGGKWEKGMFHHFKVEPPTRKLGNFPSLFASGGQAAFDKKKWQELGGMDLLYKPFYWEDTDLGYRAWKRGWKIIWSSKPKVVHDHQKSVIASNFSKSFITATAQRNQFLFIWKNIRDRDLILNHLINLPKYIFRYPSAFFRALCLLPRVLQVRSREAKKIVKSDGEILAQWK